MQPGHLIHHEPVETSITGARAWRVRYLSRDIAERDQEVTGLVIAPTAVGSDRPIVTWLPLLRHQAGERQQLPRGEGRRRCMGGIAPRPAD